MLRLGKKILAFGHRVIGKQRAEIEKQLDVEKKTQFGPRVLGTKVVPGTNTPAKDSEPVTSAAGAQQAVETMSVANLKDMLEKNPAYIDHYIDMERARPGGPRRKAVKIMYAVERAGARREAVLKQLKRMDPGEVELPENLTDDVETKEDGTLHVVKTANQKLAEIHQDAGAKAGPLKPAEEVLGKS